MKTEKIKNTTSNLAIKLIVGGIFLVFGLATLEFYIGIVFLMVSLVAITYSTGIEIDYEKHELRCYTRYLWKIKGKWIKLHHFKKISVKTSRKGIRQYGGRSGASTSRSFTFYDVVLLSNHNIPPIVMFSSKNIDQSKSFAMIWSEKLDIALDIQ